MNKETVMKVLAAAAMSLYLLDHVGAQPSDAGATGSRQAPPSH
jgi:hypothetical protein